MGQIVHEAVPELKCVVVEQTYPHDPSWADIDPAVDIWCPLWAFIDRGTIERKIAGGDEVWSYTVLVQRRQGITRNTSRSRTSIRPTGTSTAR